MKRLHAFAEFAFGMVTVPIPRAIVVCSAIGIVEAYLGLAVGAHALVVIGVALVAMLVVAVVHGRLIQIRFERAVAELPESVFLQRGPEGNLIAVVTKQGGGVAVVSLPEGYDPREDNGRLLLQEIAPEISFGEDDDGA